MKRFVALALTGFAWLVASAALAQTTLLNQLEQRLQNPAAGAAGAAAATPETGYLGAKFDDKVDAVHGVKVNSVRTGTPAESAGLKAGDYIAAIDGKPTMNWTQFDAILDNTKPGQKVELTIDRGGQKQQLAVTLGNPPPKPAAEAGAGTSAATPSLGAPTTAPGTASPPAATSPSLFPATPPGASPSATDGTTRPGISAQPLNLGPTPSENPSLSAPGGYGSLPSFGGGHASLGITVIPLTNQFKAELGFPAEITRGALVDVVKPGSAAEAAGVPARSLIVRMNSKPITSPDDLVNAIRLARPNQEIELQYYVGDNLQTKMVKLGAAVPSVAAPGVSPSLGGVEPPGATFNPSPSFGPGAAPGAGAPPAGESPLRLGGAPPGGGLLNRVERLAGNVARAAQGGGVGGGGGMQGFGRTASTVYDPLQMLELQKAVADLQQRLGAIEAKLGIRSGSQGPAPGLGSPGGAGTNP